VLPGAACPAAAVCPPLPLPLPSLPLPLPSPPSPSPSLPLPSPSPSPSPSQEQWGSRAKVVAQADWNVDLLRRPLSGVVVGRPDAGKSRAGAQPSRADAHLHGQMQTLFLRQAQAPDASGAHPMAWEPASLAERPADVAACTPGGALQSSKALGPSFKL